MDSHLPNLIICNESTPLFANRLANVLLNVCGLHGNPVFTLNCFNISTRQHKVGGSVWESNPPKAHQVPPNGFEVRGAHRDPDAPQQVQYILGG